MYRAALYSALVGLILSIICLYTWPMRGLHHADRHEPERPLSFVPTFPSDTNIHLAHICAVSIDLAVLDPFITSAVLGLGREQPPHPLLPHEALGLDYNMILRVFVPQERDGGAKGVMEFKYRRQRAMAAAAWSGMKKILQESSVKANVPRAMVENLERLISRAAAVFSEPETWEAYRDEILPQLANGKKQWLRHLVLTGSVSMGGGRHRATLAQGNERRARLAEICRGYPNM